MMSKQRENAPLVEVIAELKWELPEFPAPGSGVPAFIGPDIAEKFERQFENFGDLVSAEHSYRERLTPPNFPLLTHQPTYRFANRQDGQHTTLCQIGPGILSIHAVPPYESWSKFKTVVEICLQALLESIHSEDGVRISSIDLRYVDAFKRNLTQQHTTISFLQQVMGFDFSLPQVISQHLIEGEAVTPYSQLRIPMADNFFMLISVGEGTASGESAVIADTSVTKFRPVENSVSSLMKDLDRAHDVIRDVFDGLTKKISHLMPEVGGVE